MKEAKAKTREGESNDKMFQLARANDKYERKIERKKLMKKKEKHTIM